MNWSERNIWDAYYLQLRQSRFTRLLHEIESELEFNEPIKPFIAETLAEITDGVLDIGSGPFSNTYLDPSIKYVRVDFSSQPFFLNYDNTKSVVADVLALPFQDDAFNAVVSKETYCYQMEPIKMLQEMIRVLKPGGKFILMDSEVDLPASQIDRAVDFNPEELKPLITSLGIEDVQVFRLREVSGSYNGVVATGHISALVGTKS